MLRYIDIVSHYCYFKVTEAPNRMGDFATQVGNDSSKHWSTCQCEQKIFFLSKFVIPIFSDTYISFRRSIIKATWIKFIICVFNDFWWEEHVQNTTECTPIPVISDSATVVTFSSHIAKGIIWHLLEKKARECSEPQPSTWKPYQYGCNLFASHPEISGNFTNCYFPLLVHTGTINLLIFNYFNKPSNQQCGILWRIIAPTFSTLMEGGLPGFMKSFSRTVCNCLAICMCKINRDTVRGP